MCLLIKPVFRGGIRLSYGLSIKLGRGLRITDKIEMLMLASSRQLIDLGLKVERMERTIVDELPSFQ